MLFKDACNRKSNQQNLGTIKCSNLCTEIVEYTSPEEAAVCNLASIALPMMVKTNDATNEIYFDFDLLKEVTMVATKNLNKIIDRNFYPIPEAKTSNLRHRPIGIGVQGLADTFQMMKLVFDGVEARQLNKDIFETIYYGAVSASCALAEQLGPYETYEGSPSSRGLLQFDLWNVTPSNRWDWKSLKEKMAQHGLRNSLLVAPMPTASTAQILGNNESTEPFTSNMYNRRVLAGEFTVVNKHLLRELTANGLWSESVRNRIIADNGSIQNVLEIPKHIRDIYRTVWEIPQKAILEMSADRGPYICQSQSLNVHIGDPDTKKLTSMHFFAYNLGLKTGMYYLRTRPKADAIKFTVDQEQLIADKLKQQATLQDKENVRSGPIVASIPAVASAVTKPAVASPPSTIAPMQSGTAGLTIVDEDEGCLNCGA
jgi:ribonucleoside-diphosphate reductase subunit M1